MKSMALPKAAVAVKPYAGGRRKILVIQRLADKGLKTAFSKEGTSMTRKGCGRPKSEDKRGTADQDTKELGTQMVVEMLIAVAVAQRVRHRGLDQQPRRRRSRRRMLKPKQDMVDPFKGELEDLPGRRTCQRTWRWQAASSSSSSTSGRISTQAGTATISGQRGGESWRCGARSTKHPVARTKERRRKGEEKKRKEKVGKVKKER